MSRSAFACRHCGRVLGHVRQSSTFLCLTEVRMRVHISQGYAVLECPECGRRRVFRGGIIATSPSKKAGEMSNAVLGFIGVIVGAIAAFGGTYYAQWQESKRERAQIRQERLIALQDAARSYVGATWRLIHIENDDEAFSRARLTQFEAMMVMRSMASRVNDDEINEHLNNFIDFADIDDLPGEDAQQEFEGGLGEYHGWLEARITILLGEILKSS
jgi:predicted RNA-binding Zn-ribbon protein involved in translation (DUF1610 family)